MGKKRSASARTAESKKKKRPEPAPIPAPDFDEPQEKPEESSSTEAGSASVQEIETPHTAENSRKKPSEAGGEETESKKPTHFQRLWSNEDEIVLLKGVAQYTAEKGVDVSAMNMGNFEPFIKSSLSTDYNKTQLREKIRRFRIKYSNYAAKAKTPSDPHEMEIFELSSKIWGQRASPSPPPATTPADAASPKGKANSAAKATVSAQKEEVSKGKPAAAVSGLDHRSSLNMGLPTDLVKKLLESSGGGDAETKRKWKALQVAELELFLNKTELMKKQLTLVLDAFKASDK